MKLIGFFITLLFASLFVIDCATAYVKSSSDLNDQIAVELTVYNSNIALIKDKRDVRLARGLVELHFMDVASGIIPTSVSIKSESKDGINIIEQNYEYDLLSPQKLLNKYVGKEVKLYTKNPYTEKEEILKALILSNNEGVPVFQIGNEITFNHPGRIIFPEIPENLISKPTLLWLLDNKAEERQKIEARYLTNGINWRASYVAVLNEADDRMDLSGWVTIDNKSGALYKNARLKLVAGDINRVDEFQLQRAHEVMLSARKAETKEQFTEQEFFEYHIYTLERPTTIKNNQIKQISLLDVKNIPVKKEFVFQGATYYYTSKYGEISPKQKVSVFIELSNKKEHNLGIPLPKGIIRVYKHDHDKSLQLVGENTIDHTPKDEKIRIKLGEAFDVVASRKQTDWQKLSDRLYEAAFEIAVRNHKKEDIIVKIIEPLIGEWSILQSSHDFKKMDAHTINFHIPVAKDKETKLTYRVGIKL